MIFRGDQPVMGPAGVPLMREVFFPARVTEVIDTWESTGLRGTASHDYAVSDVFVPTAHTVWFQDPPGCDRALYRMPPIAMFALARAWPRLAAAGDSTLKNSSWFLTELTSTAGETPRLQT